MMLATECHGRAPCFIPAKVLGYELAEPMLETERGRYVNRPIDAPGLTNLVPQFRHYISSRTKLYKRGMPALLALTTTYTIQRPH